MTFDKYWPHALFFALLGTMLTLGFWRASMPAKAQTAKNATETQAEPLDQMDDRAKATQRFDLLEKLRAARMAAASRLLGSLSSKFVQQDLRSRGLEVTTKQLREIDRIGRFAKAVQLRLLTQQLPFLELDEPERSSRLKDAEQHRQQTLHHTDQIVLKGILTPAQGARLEQIRWQSSPEISLIEDEKLRQALKITNNQIEEMKIRWKYAQKVISRPPPEIAKLLSDSITNRDPIIYEQYTTVATRFGKQVRGRVYEVLTPGQLGRFRALMGPRWMGSQLEF